MNCQGIDQANPFLWILAAGFFAGAAVSRLTVIPSRARNPRRAAALKYPLFSIYLSMALLLGAAGLIFSGSVRFLTPRSLYFFLCVAGASFAAVRFKRAVGAPLFFIVLGWFVYMQLMLTGWSCYSGTEEIARLRVLDRGEERIVISMDWGDDTDIFETDGPVPEVEIMLLEIDSPYVLHGGKYYYRFPADEGRHTKRLASVMPGIRYRRHTASIDEEIELFQLYRIVLEGNEVTVRAVY